MATIDDKVVAMSFENSKFESGVNQSLRSIDKLKAALQFKEAGKGLIQVGNAAHQVDLGHIHKGVEEVSSKLNALRLTAVAVFADIAKRALEVGKTFVKAFTVDPLKAGFQEYSTQLNSVQTILANTQASGATLKDVNRALDELNTYSDKTIYNFGQMARNIGTFTAAGVDLKTATASIKGIANLAALSGSNAEQAATAMYQLSQAISSGSVKLMDWNSVVNAGMGGTVFQRALALTGEHMGKLKEGTVQLVGPMKNVKIAGESFRNSLSAPGKDGWLTSDVLTKTLKMFTSDMTDAELAADGWNKKEIKAIQAQAKSAMLAATNVKTLQQVLAVAKETAGSGWAKTWRIVFGDFGEAKKTFTNLSNTINSMIIDSARARNNMLGDWKALGGRKVLIEGIKEAFHNLGEVLKPIKAAFREFFPRTTGKQLFDLTVRFKEFAESLKPSETTIKNLHRTFRGLFAVLDIGKEIIFGLFGVLRKLFGEAGKGSGSFLEFTASVGDALTAFHDWLIEGGRLAAFFDKLGNLLAAPIDLLKALGQALSDMFSGVSFGGASGQIKELATALTPFQTILEVVSMVWNDFVNAVANSGQYLQPILDGIVKTFQTLGPAISEALNGMNFQAILAVVRTGLLTGLVLMFRKFLGKGSAINQITKGFGGGILGNIKGTFSALQGSMTALQQNIKAKTLKEIAIAVALLTASVVALSFVDPERLKSSLAAMTVAFGQLLGAMAILGNVTKTMGFIKIPVIAASMILLAGAIDVLSIAVVILSRLSWGELIKGLAGIGVSLAILVKAVGPLSASSPGMIKAGIGMMAIAIALRIMANAVEAFGRLDLPTLGKGLGSIAVSLGIMVKAMGAMPTKGMISAGIGLVLLGTGLRILAEAVGAFGAMGIATLAKGLIAVSIGLEAIAFSMQIMPKGMILQAAGLLLIAAALNGIALAIKTMGGMSIENLAKGIGALAVTLALLAVALIVMEGSIGGAVALGVAAAGVSLLAGALQKMGGMSWMEIIKGMVALAGALTILGLAATLITPAIPSLLGLGVGLLLIGGALALTGAGLFLIAAGLSALVVAAPTGFGVLLAAVTEFQKGLIENIKLFVLGLLEIVRALADTSPQFVDAIVKILNSVIDGLIQIVPKLVPLVNTIITTLIALLHQNQPKLIQAGYDLIIGLLQGLRNNINEITKLVVEIIAAFIAGIAKNISKIVTSGVKLVTAFLKAIASGYAGITKAAISIITKFISAIANNIGKVATAGLSVITKLLSAIAKSLGRVIKAGTDVIVAFINGVGNAGPRIIAAATNAIIKFINALSKNGVKLANAGMVAIVQFLNGVARAIDAHAPEIRQAGMRVGVAIINGMTSGITSKAQEIYNKIGEVVRKAKDKLKVWDSPPEAFGKKVGRAVVLGLADGLSEHTKAVDAAASMSQGVISTVKDTFEITSPSKVMKRIGREVTAGFAAGIKSGVEEDIRGAFANMKQLLNEQQASIQKQIARREELQRKKKPTKEETAELNKLIDAVGKHQKALQAVTRAQDYLNKGIDANKKKLFDQAKSYTDLLQRIEDVNGLIQELKDQYSDLPEIIREADDAEGEQKKLTGAEQLAQYTKDLTAQVAAVKRYNEILQALRAAGLDDTTYRMLLEEGTTGLEFAQGLLDAGAPAINQLKTLDTDLGSVSDTLGKNAASNLYTAGKYAAQGLLAGLQAEKTNLETEMVNLANVMVRTIKNKLKIKSPSEVFAEIGKLSMEGMAQGFTDGSQNVSDSVDDAAQSAIDAMRKSMREISNVMTEEINPNPTITPVLDLTQVKSKAAELAALQSKFALDAAYGQATAISSTQSAQATETEQIAAAGGTSVKFEQNNYSPESLSDIEIYRQTKNQLSMLKSSLALT